MHMDCWIAINHQLFLSSRDRQHCDWSAVMLHCPNTSSSYFFSASVTSCRLSQEKPMVWLAFSKIVCLYPYTLLVRKNNTEHYVEVTNQRAYNSVPKRKCLSYRVTQSQFLCRKSPLEFRPAVVLPLLKFPGLLSPRSLLLLLFFHFILLLYNNCSSAQHVWYFRVSSVRFVPPIELGWSPRENRVHHWPWAYSHPDVQKFKPTALRMAKA